MRKIKPIFCLSCCLEFDNDEGFDLHPCKPIFKMIKRNITKRTRWYRFIDIFLLWNIICVLALMLQIFSLPSVNGYIHSMYSLLQLKAYH